MSVTTTNNDTASMVRKGYVAALTLPSAHWFLRLPLAAIIWNQGVMKFPEMADQAASNGIPFVLFFLAAVGEVLAAVGLIVGGLVKTWNPSGWKSLLGDVITRLSGFAVAAVTAGVIWLFYGDSFYSMQFHLMILAGGLFLLLRGNRA